MITQRLTEPGNFDISLTGVPKPIWDLLAPGGYYTWGTVLVTPTRLDAAEMTVPGLQSKALFGGVLHEVSPSSGRITGPGLLWHLGGSGEGQIVNMDAISGQSATALGWVERALVGYAPWNWVKSGLLVGTGTSYLAPLTWTAGSGTAGTWYSRLEVMEWVRDTLAFPLEWDVTPAGLVNFGYSWEVFPSSTQILITRKEASGWSSVETPSFAADEFGVSRSAQDVGNIAIVSGKDGSTGYAISPVTYSWLNPVTHDLFHRAFHIDRNDVTGSWVANAAAAEVAKRDKIATTITVSGAAYQTSAASLPKAGQWAAVYDPANGIVDPTAQPVMLRGVEVWPQSVRIHSSTWPVKFGMGVYVTTWTAALGWMALDLSDYVVPDTSDWSLEIARARRGLPVT